MADSILQDSQHVTLGIAPGPDALGNPTTIPFDAGSVTATFADSTELSAVVSGDQTSILVTALGPLTAVGVADVLHIAGTVTGADGVAVAVSVDFPMDVTAGSPKGVIVTPGTPAAN